MFLLKSGTCEHGVASVSVPSVISGVCHRCFPISRAFAILVVKSISRACLEMSFSPAASRRVNIYWSSGRRHNSLRKGSKIESLFCVDINYLIISAVPFPYRVSAIVCICNFLRTLSAVFEWVRVCQALWVRSVGETCGTSGHSGVSVQGRNDC